MALRFKYDGADYEPLKPFDVDIPPLCVLTGINGSGKSRLISGISKGTIEVYDGDQKLNHEDIAFVNMTDTDTDTGARTGIIDHMGRDREDNWSHRRLNGGPLESVHPKKHSGEKVISQIEGISECYASHPINWDKIAALLGVTTKQTPTPQSAGTTLKAIAETEGDGFINMTFQDILDHYIAKTGVRNFSNYSIIEHRQRHYSEYFQAITELLNTGDDLGATERMRLLDELNTPDLTQKFNEIMDQFGLRIALDPPDYKISLKGDVYQNTIAYQPSKISRDSKPFNTTHLSSGEGAVYNFCYRLLALALNDEGKAVVARPKLLLIDEFDRHLHPEMKKQLLEGLQGEFVEKNKISVLMTTHSSTTVALAPDKAIFEMRDGKPQWVSKQIALNNLSVGVPTLSVSYQDRRLVLCESESDAEIYNAVYGLFSKDLESEISLNFVGVGRKKADGSEENSGCDQVRKWAEQTRGNGVGAHIYGLIDWDAKTNNKRGNNLFVLCEGRRYAIENLIFDPVLVVSYLALTQKKKMQEKGIWAFPNIDGAVETPNLHRFSQAQWQRQVDKFIEKIGLPNGQDESDKKTEVSYRKAGMKLEIPSWYLECNGHVLFDHITCKICVLKAGGAITEKKLALMIIEKLNTPTGKELFPAEFEELFKEMQEYQPT